MAETSGDATRWERAGAASGYAVLAVSAAALAFERGAPAPGSTADELSAFLAANRGSLVAQSVLFVVGQGLLLWFLAVLSSHLRGAEGGRAPLSTLVLGAGVTAAAVNLLAQAFQVGLAQGAADRVPLALAATMDATFAVANLPLAVMLAAVAALSLGSGVLPAWFGWLSALASASSVVLALAVAAETGPLAPAGSVNAALYAVFVGWLLAATVVLRRGVGSSTRSG